MSPNFVWRAFDNCVFRRCSMHLPAGTAFAQGLLQQSCEAIMSLGVGALPSSHAMSALTSLPNPPPSGVAASGSFALQSDPAPRAAHASGGKSSISDEMLNLLTQMMQVSDSSDASSGTSSASSLSVSSLGANSLTMSPVGSSLSLSPIDSLPPSASVQGLNGGPAEFAQIWAANQSVPMVQNPSMVAMFENPLGPASMAGTSVIS
jgi:hypothetical protein